MMKVRAALTLVRQRKEQPMSYKRFLVGCVVLAGAWICCAGSASTGEPPVWKPLADGKTLNGWHKNGDGQWTIEDGAYVGRSDKAKLYGHLVSDAQYQDFTVRFDFLCPSGDSGFFVRTEMQEPDKTLGLQIQVGPLGTGTGGIYESYGRGWLPEKPPAALEEAGYRKGEWNEMIITAYGPHVTVHVNGVKTADMNDDKLSQKPGVFALQMHSGVVNETRFKNLAILERGEIIPKTFFGADATPVKAGENGIIALTAASGLGVGPQIRYMPAWGAFGWFTDKDRVEWPLDVPAAGVYDVSMEAAVADDQAGKPFVLEIGDQKLEGKTTASGSWENYTVVKVGQIKVAAGAQRAVLRPAGQFDKPLCDLRQIKLTPAQ
jgi:hypothetical protein